jgi:uncharacterized alpha-E superfamily protein
MMQGGLTRSSAEKDRYVISNQYGGISKDTWIVSDTLTEARETTSTRTKTSVTHYSSLPSRSAENLFWVGRYCERTMGVTKFLKIVINALNENVDFRGSFKSEYIEVLLKSTTHLTLTYPGFTDEKNDSIRENPYQEISVLVSNSQKVGTIASNVESFLQSVLSVSDKWNHDTRRVINLVENSRKKIQSIDSDNPNNIQKALDKLHVRLFTFFGVLSETMPRDSGFFLLEAGKLIERILSKINILRSFFSFKTEENVESELIEAALTNHYLLVHYRQLYKTNFSLDSMLEMVLLDKKLPYSLVYQLDALAECLAQLPKTEQPDRLNQAEKAVLNASTKIKLADISRLTISKSNISFRRNLDRLLAEVAELISSVTVSLTHTYFAHTVIQHVLMENPDNSDAHEI